MAANGILSLVITDKAVLYAAYMPYVKCGGIFIPTNKQYDLGSEVFMLLKLLDQPEKLPVTGKVVWVTPARTPGPRVRGIGIQFNDPGRLARSRIENLLAGQLQSDTPTHTI